MEKEKRKSVTKKKQEDREFQLEMLETQILCDGFNSFLTVMIAVAFTWIASMFTVSFADIPAESKINLLTSAIYMLFIALALSFGFIFFNYFYIQRRLNKIRKRFIEGAK